MSMAAWTWLIPALSFALLVGGMVAGVGPLLAVVCAAALIGAVIAAVHHAEVIAHRVGEPFGTLVLAVAVTIIEVSLILSIMLAGGPDAAALPRDTIYAAIMIICNGVVGLCILVGGLVHHEQSFRVEGSSAGLAALIALSAFSLVLPAFTTTTSGGTYSTAQLAFVAFTSAALWAVYVFTQTVRHRDYFLPPVDASSPDAHAAPPTNREAWTSFALLVVSLVAVVGLAKLLSPLIEHAVEQAGAPKAVIGIVIAMLVLLPETWAAVRAAHANRLQTSMNLGARIGAGDHRTDDSRRGRDRDCSRYTADSGPRAEGSGDAGRDFAVERRHAGNRPHSHDAGRRAPRRLRGVSVSRVPPLERNS